jgi:iron(III) transport system substrate-binding protein
MQVRTRFTTMLAALLAMAAPAVAESITVYTAYEEDEAAAFLRLAKVDMPDLDVRMLRLSTGDLTARILAEAANPQHDVVWGQAVTNLVDPRVLATLEAYTPKGLDKLPAQFRDPGAKWFAVTGYMAAFCVNNERLKAKGLPMPKSWADLTNPAFKGEVVMPNPASSGTGYIQIASILQMRGDQAGWAMLAALDKNIAQYIKSGSRPCNSASAGEYAVGASYALRAIKNVAEGYPITMVLPSEGAGNELEGNALVAVSKKKELAKRFLDWTLSDKAVGEYYNWKEIVTVTGGAMPERFRKAGMPADIASVMVKMDFAAAARDRAAILARWQKEFER